MKEEYGYCRISTPKQNISRQERNIIELYPAAHIVKEVYTGTKTVGRKEWNKLYKLVKQQAETGKEITIIFDSVSRMSRNAEEGFKLYEELFNLGIDLVFLKEYLVPLQAQDFPPPCAGNQQHMYKGPPLDRLQL